MDSAHRSIDPIDYLREVLGRALCGRLGCAVTLDSDPESRHDSSRALNDPDISERVGAVLMECPKEPDWVVLAQRNLSSVDTKEAEEVLALVAQMTKHC